MQERPSLRAGRPKPGESEDESPESASRRKKVHVNFELSDDEEPDAPAKATEGSKVEDDEEEDSGSEVWGEEDNEPMAAVASHKEPKTAVASPKGPARRQSYIESDSDDDELPPPTVDSLKGKTLQDLSSELLDSAKLESGSSSQASTAENGVSAPSMASSTPKVIVTDTSPAVTNVAGSDHASFTSSPGGNLQDDFESPALLKPQLEELEEQQRQIQIGLQQALDYERRVRADELSRCQAISAELAEALTQERERHARETKERELRMERQLEAYESRWRSEVEALQAELLVLRKQAAEARAVTPKSTPKKPTKDMGSSPVSSALSAWASEDGLKTTPLKGLQMQEARSVGASPAGRKSESPRQKEREEIARYVSNRISEIATNLASEARSRVQLQKDKARLSPPLKRPGLTARPVPRWRQKGRHILETGLRDGSLHAALAGLGRKAAAASEPQKLQLPCEPRSEMPVRKQTEDLMTAAVRGDLSARDALFDRLDKNGDGVLSREEFDKFSAAQARASSNGPGPRFLSAQMARGQLQPNPPVPPQWLQLPARNAPPQLQSPSESNSVSPVSTAATNSPGRRQQAMHLPIPDISQGMHSAPHGMPLAQPQAWKWTGQEAPHAGLGYPGGCPFMGVPVPSAPSINGRVPVFAAPAPAPSLSPQEALGRGQMSPHRQQSPFAVPGRLPMPPQPQAPPEDWRYAGPGRALPAYAAAVSRGSSRAQSPQPISVSRRSEPSLQAPAFPAPKVVHPEEQHSTVLGPGDRVRQRAMQATVMTRAPSAPVTSREARPELPRAASGPRSLQEPFAGPRSLQPPAAFVR